MIEINGTVVRPGKAMLAVVRYVHEAAGPTGITVSRRRLLTAYPPHHRGAIDRAEDAGLIRDAGDGAPDRRRFVVTPLGLAVLTAMAGEA
jgi:hypothetical protein